MTSFCFALNYKRSKTFSFLLLKVFLILTISAHAQKDSTILKDAAYSPSDKTIVDSLLSTATTQSWDKLEMGELALRFANRLKGIPYQGGTLDRLPNEQLIIRLDSLDCVTFVETVVALSLAAKAPNPSFSTFANKLQQIRYRKGQRQGYASRLHYFCDWIRDNESKQVLQDITANIGGEAFSKPIDFMTKHRKLYPHLADDSTFMNIKKMEDNLNKQQFVYLPKNNLQSLTESVKDGDIFAITSTINGIDINHVGFAYVKSGRTYMIHASSTGKKVEVSAKPLADYLAGIKKDSGLMVLRLKE